MFLPIDELMAEVALPVRLGWPDLCRAQLLILSHHNLVIRGVELDGPAMLDTQVDAVETMLRLLGIGAVADTTCPLLFDVILLRPAIELFWLAGVL